MTLIPKFKLMKKLSQLLGFLLLLTLFGCESNVELSNDLSSFKIRYERNSGWVQYSYNATIDQNGKLVVNERHQLSNINRENEYNLPNEKLNLMKEKLEELMTIKMAEKYGFDFTNAPTDMPTRKILYETALKKDSTLIYFPKENELPEELDAFMKVLEQLISDCDLDKN